MRDFQGQGQVLEAKTKDFSVEAKAKDLMAEAKARATAFCSRGSSRPRTCPRGHISADCWVFHLHWTFTVMFLV